MFVVFFFSGFIDNSRRVTRARSQQVVVGETSIDEAIEPLLGLRNSVEEDDDASTDTDLVFKKHVPGRPKQGVSCSGATADSRPHLPPAMSTGSISFLGVGVTGPRIQFPEDDKLIVNEDKRIIDGLGVATWKTLLLNGVQGLQEVRHSQ